MFCLYGRLRDVTETISEGGTMANLLTVKGIVVSDCHTE